MNQTTKEKNEFMHFYKKTEKFCVSVVVNNNKCSVVIHDGTFIKEYILDEATFALLKV